MQNARDVYELRERQARRKKVVELICAVLAASALTTMVAVFYQILTR